MKYEYFYIFPKFNINGMAKSGFAHGRPSTQDRHCQYITISNSDFQIDQKVPCAVHAKNYAIISGLM